MRFYRTAILAAATAIVLSPANAGHPVVIVAAPIVKAVSVAAPVTPAVTSSAGGTSSAGFSGGGSSSGAGAALVGGFIAAVAIAIIVHEVRGPKCASNTKYKRRHGYDTPTFWRPLCKFKRAPTVKPIRVRG